MRTQRRGIDRDAGVDQAALAVVDREHLAGIGPEIVDRGLRAAMAFLGAVAEPHHPFRRMPDMIGAFLFRFRRDRRQRRIARFHHRAPIEIGEGRVEELPHHGAGEIAVRLFQQQQIAILPDVAQVGELVLVVALAFDLRRIGIELARLAEQVEAHIGERHVLFHASAHGRTIPTADARGSAHRRRGAARTAPAGFRRLDGGGGHVQYSCLLNPSSLRSARKRASRRMKPPASRPRDSSYGACAALLTMRAKLTYARLRPARRRTSDAGRSWIPPARTSCPSRTDRTR